MSRSCRIYLRIYSHFVTDRVPDDIVKYHDQARLVPRHIHPFMNVHEALTFGLTYNEADIDWDNKDKDEGEGEDEECSML